VRFGRVEGLVVPVEEGGQTLLRLTVYLETGDRLQVVREEVVPPVGPIEGAAALAWHADQLTQETIGNELATLGWEAIGGSEVPTPEPGEVARSASYAVRNLG
jgi:hypothetical protein